MVFGVFFAGSLRSANDERLLTVAASEGRTLVTLDRDFTNILRHPPAPTAGIVVIRLHDQTLPRIRHVATNLAARLMQESARGRLWVLDESRLYRRYGLAPGAHQR